MKKTAIIILSFLLAVTSCNKDNTYSCDPEVNEWAIEHIELYESAPRPAIVTLPWTRQRAIYSGLSPEKKIQLWKEKVILLKKESKYSIEAMNEFEEWVNLMRPDHFLHNTVEENYDLESAGDILENRLKEVYNLQDEDITFILYKWTTEDEYYTARQLDRPITTKADGFEYNGGEGDDPLCECVESHDCLNLSCDKHNSNCKTPNSGCGKGGIYDCTQMCS